MEKCLLKKPTKIIFKAVIDNSGNSSHRRRSAADESIVVIDDLKLGD